MHRRGKANGDTALHELRESSIVSTSMEISVFEYFKKDLVYCFKKRSRAKEININVAKIFEEKENMYLP